MRDQFGMRFQLAGEQEYHMGLGLCYFILYTLFRNGKYIAAMS